MTMLHRPKTARSRIVLWDEPADAQPRPRSSTDATGWTDARARRSPAGLGACGAVIAHMQCLITGFQLVPKLNLDAGVSFHQLWTPPWQDDPTPGCTP